MEMYYQSLPFPVHSLLPNHLGEPQLTDTCHSKREKRQCIILQEGE